MEDLLRTTPITPLLSIREQHGAQDVAYRVVGDPKRLDINDTMKQSDAHSAASIDRICAIDRALGERLVRN